MSVRILLFLFLIIGVASAGTVWDTTSIGTPTNTCCWSAGIAGAGSMPTWGEVFTAPDGESSLASITLYLKSWSPTMDPVNYAAYLFEFSLSPLGIVGDPLFQTQGSQANTLNEWSALTFTPNAPVTPGKTYAFFLTTLGVANSSTLYFGERAYEIRDAEGQPIAHPYPTQWMGSNDYGIWNPEKGAYDPASSGDSSLDVLRDPKIMGVWGLEGMDNVYRIEFGQADASVPEPGTAGLLAAGILLISTKLLRRK